MSKHKLSRETRTIVFPPGLIQPDDLLTFIYFNHFTAEWKRLKLDDDDLRTLECLIMASPTGPPIMGGTGGLRKARFVPPGWNTGKRGALRIGYVYIEECSVVGLIIVFAKNEKANLTAREKKEVKQLIDRFRAIVESGG